MKHTSCWLCGAVYVVGGCGGVVCECAFALECGTHDLRVQQQLEARGRDPRQEEDFWLEKMHFPLRFCCFSGTTDTHYTALLIARPSGPARMGCCTFRMERVGEAPPSNASERTASDGAAVSPLSHPKPPKQRHPASIRPASALYTTSACPSAKGVKSQP